MSKPSQVDLVGSQSATYKYLLSAVAILLVVILGIGISPRTAYAIDGVENQQPGSPSQSQTIPPSFEGQGPIEVNYGADAQSLPRDLKYVWSFVIADADTGQILAMKDPDRQLPQASTLKVLTALTTMPHLDRTSTYYGTTQDETMEGSKVGVKPGSTYSVDDLYHGMLMPSGNDAASGVANANGGWKPTIAAMNAEAQRVGATNTVAKTPNGLDEPGQHSTARDLVTIFRNAMQIPTFADVVSVKKYTFPGPQTDENGKPVKTRGSYPIWTTNRLLLNDYPGSIGGKTGFTSQAGRTFVAGAQRGGRTLMISLMRSARSTEVEAEKLLTWGFDNANKVTPVGTLPEIAPRLPEQNIPAVQLQDNGTPRAGQETTIEDLTAANEGKTLQSVAQATGADLGSGLISNLYKPLLWLFTFVLLAVAVLRIRVMVLAAQRGSGSASKPGSHIDLRQSERDQVKPGRSGSSN